MNLRTLECLTSHLRQIAGPPHVAHYNLANVLYDKGDLDGAIEEYRAAIKLSPKPTLSHNKLGNVLRDKGDLDGAIAEYRAALKLDPKFAFAQNNLSRAERMRELLPRLPDVLAGRADPKNPAETCEFAVLCAEPLQKRYVEAVRLYDKAFSVGELIAKGLHELTDADRDIRSGKTPCSSPKCIHP